MFKVFARFLKDESAVGTIMALFWFVICAGIVGLSVDTANAWRQKERLQLTADVASHAGVLAILAGGNAPNPADIRQAAHNSIVSNMPASGFGRVIDSDINDIILGDYDTASNRLVDTGDISAVTVQLHRSDVVDNPVGTYLLQFVGFTSWEVERQGTTVLEDFGDCPLNEGIFAHGKISSNDDNLFGPDFCVHSQDFVDLPQDTTWEDGSWLGMPSLLDCKTKCVNSANAGVEQAKHEINLIMPTFNDVITRTFANMQNPTSVQMQKFWTGKSLGQPQLLTNWNLLFGPSVPGPNSAGYVPPPLGTAVSLTVDQFESMDHPPAGLTYLVTCNPNGNGIKTHLNMNPTASGDPVRDLVVLTNCSVDFMDNSDWRGVMVVSTRERANATLTATSGAHVGDPTNTCNQDDQSFIFSRSDMQVAAEFASSNVTFVIGGDVQIASGTSGEVSHYGMSVYSDRTVNLTTNHNYYACNYPVDNDIVGLPEHFKYIKQVLPENESEWIANN